MFDEGNITTTPYQTSHVIEDENLPPSQNSEDSSDDSSTDSNAVEQGHTKPLDISDIQTSEEIPELSEQDVLPGNVQLRTSSRNRKQITIFEDNPDN